MADKGTAGNPIRCKAAVAREPGKPLVIEEITVAPPSPHEVRIKIICTSLCHTDITFWQWPVLPHTYPRILGHEAVGIVESVGEYVEEVTEGDMVIPTFLSECKECADCKSEESNLCSNIPFKVSPWMPRYDTSRFTDINGETLYHMVHVSSFSEYTVVDVANICKIDPTIPPSRACLLGCGVSTGFGAAWKTANVKAGSTVAIFGLGSVGLAVAEGSRLCGAARIIGVDVNPKKFEVGKIFGLTDFISAENSGAENSKPVSQVIKEMTNGGADYCFECVGSSSLVREAYYSCRKGWGMTVVMGLGKPGDEITLDSLDFILDKKSLLGCMYGGLKIKTDIPTLVKLYMDKELNLDDFLTHEIKFQDINKAFDLLIEGKCLKCVIWMDK